MRAASDVFERNRNHLDVLSGLYDRSLPIQFSLSVRDLYNIEGTEGTIAMHYIIYIFTNKDNNKSYIGLTTQKLERRVYLHH